MKYLHLKEINLNYYDAVGFDMDGTLYKEVFFIKQAYYNIARYLNNDLTNNVYKWMLKRWIEKGSGYPFIFSETIEQFNLTNVKIEEILKIYRETMPNLNLEKVVSSFIEETPIEKRFLVTDGHSKLQRNKFEALKLDKFFLEENCGFTGDLGHKYYKPSVEIVKKIQFIQGQNKKVLYLGDRNLDEQFSKNAHFDFAFVRDFDEFWGVMQ